ncbi:unnamed protein product [Ostreobium quekettii]|uniref:Uncharacterized protein n=1 Tax=Ostreobium quekettii TaxID=121088 RepID=A0A8S1IWD8_9CHLO|nr:unnamed protein product [Ostreobium quekettii]
MARYCWCEEVKWRWFVEDRQSQGMDSFRHGPSPLYITTGLFVGGVGFVPDTAVIVWLVKFVFEVIDLLAAVCPLMPLLPREGGNPALSGLACPSSGARQQRVRVLLPASCCMCTAERMCAPLLPNTPANQPDIL